MRTLTGEWVTSMILRGGGQKNCEEGDESGWGGGGAEGKGVELLDSLSSEFCFCLKLGGESPRGSPSHNIGEPFWLSEDESLGRGGLFWQPRGNQTD